MIHCLLSFVLILLSHSASAYTRMPPSYIDYEKFVHLSKGDQNKIILTFMDYAVEAESEYEKELKSSSVSPEKLKYLKKIVDAYKSLQSQIISEAHAEENIDDFIAAQKKAYTGADNNCLYAGWLSKVRTITYKLGSVTKSKTVCTHPGSLQPNDKMKTDFKKGPCKIPAEISCNPLIFGYAKNDNKTLFCVPGNADSANSSLACKEESIGNKASPEERVTRIAKLREAYLSKPDKYNEMTKMIHKSCLCQVPPEMSKKYFNVIREHRTCYALLTQYQGMLDKCDEKISISTATGIDIGSITKLHDEVLNKITDKSTNLTKSEVDKVFATIKGPVTEQFCKDAVAKAGAPAPTCTATGCLDAEGKKSCDVTITNGLIKDGNVATKKLEFLKDKIDVVVVDGDKKDKTVSCGYVAAATKASCEVLKCVSESNDFLNCEFKVNNGALKDTKQTTFKVSKADKNKVVKISLTDESEVECLPKDEETKSSCKLSIVANKDPMKVDVSLILTLLEGDTPTSPPIFDPDFAATTDDKQLEYKATIDLATIATGKKITASKFSTKFPNEVCSETFPKAPEGMKIVVTKTEEKPAAGSVIVIFILKGTLSGTGSEKEKDNLVWEPAVGTKVGDDPYEIKVEQKKVPQDICLRHKDDKIIPKDPSQCQTIPGSGEATKATLSLAGKNRSNQNFDVKAAVTLAGEDFSVVLSKGYTLVWYEKNKPELTVEEKAAKDKKDADRIEAEKKVADKDKKKPEKKKGDAGDSKTDDTKDKPATKTAETKDAKAVDGEVQTGTAITYSASIGTAKYEICANLMKDGKVEANACKTVPGYTAPVQQQMGPPPVPGAYRYRRW